MRRKYGRSAGATCHVMRLLRQLNADAHRVSH